MTTIYRNIYEKHFGPIPKDEMGRTFEIHHIDGNKNNNHLSNLQCVSIIEHYEIHKRQGDMKACLIMSDRMKISPEEKIEISKICNQGENNPSYGSKWINNGFTNIKIKKNEDIPTGWSRGRLFDQAHKDTFSNRSKIGDKNSRYNSTLYRFKNKNTQEIIVATGYDFSKMCDLSLRTVRKLIACGLKTYKGWEIIK